MVRMIMRIIMIPMIMILMILILMMVRVVRMRMTMMIALRCRHQAEPVEQRRPVGETAAAAAAADLRVPLARRPLRTEVVVACPTVYIDYAKTLMRPEIQVRRPTLVRSFG